MWEWFHLLLGKPCSLPTLDPRPRLDVRSGILSLAGPRQKILGLTRILAGQVDL